MSVPPPAKKVTKNEVAAFRWGHKANSDFDGWGSQSDPCSKLDFLWPPLTAVGFVVLFFYYKREVAVMVGAE